MTPSGFPLDSASQRHARELELLGEISRLLDHGIDLREVAVPMMEAIARQTGLEAVSWSLPELRDASTAATPSPELPDAPGAALPAAAPLFRVPVKIGREDAGILCARRPQGSEADSLQDVRLLEIIASMIAQAVKLRRAVREGRDRLTEENARLKAELRDRFRPADIVGNSHGMKAVYDRIAQASKNDAPVLIVGEAGTGKELVARAIHYNSLRAARPFVQAHCAALPADMMESELFGIGDASSPAAAREGLFERADGGTLLLDGIGDIPLAIQVKLLRVLRGREFERAGGSRTLKVDVRFIAATDRNLEEAVRHGRFLGDLYDALRAFSLFVPPLRNRKADVVLLADRFLQKYARENGKDVRRLSSAAIDMLMSYHWPGNVRELENCMERAVLTAEGVVIHPCHLPPTLQTADADGGAVLPGGLKARVGAYERDLIRDALKSSRGNIAAAARALDTTPRILGYKIRAYQIDPRPYG